MNLPETQGCLCSTQWTVPSGTLGHEGERSGEEAALPGAVSLDVDLKAGPFLDSLSVTFTLATLLSHFSS